MAINYRTTQAGALFSASVEDRAEKKSPRLDALAKESPVVALALRVGQLIAPPPLARPSGEAATR